MYDVQIGKWLVGDTLGENKYDGIIAGTMCKSRSIVVRVHMDILTTQSIDLQKLHLMNKRQ